ncbi:hypothetical protein [Paraurantiacibacter namhicola]|uniref:Uncharacterized protein n=1 Tax=Paraurantiacibacter namhicola TaxID=645517 RepID=A0A1C7D7N0_9SPHN|nr:hypothetical protein [Paraurantiacibacter namhicola]ANU07490.1 hypothetical protein A6F65_01183 [Paraurantiacibacter namhicola]
MDLILSLVMLAAIVLVVGAVWLWRRDPADGRARKQALLMLVLAGVMAANLAVWLIPDKNGADLQDRAAELSE